MSVNKERVQLLVGALRSDEFPQGQGYLQIAQGYCCLGVATEVALRNGLNLDPREAWWIDGPNSPDPRQFLHLQVQQWYGFIDDDPMLKLGHQCGGPEDCECRDEITAAEANDDGFTFSVIADAFERTYIHGDPE